MKNFTMLKSRSNLTLVFSLLLFTILLGAGVIASASVMNPHKEAQKQMWKEFSLQSLKTAGRVVNFQVQAMVMAAVVSGFLASYTLPDRAVRKAVSESAHAHSGHDKHAHDKHEHK